MTGLPRALRVILSACLLLAANLAQAMTLDELQQHFLSQPVVRAHFNQARQIKDFSQPLLSEGEMIVARDQGVLWQQTAPFPMILILTAGHMSQSVNHQPVEVITADSNPQLFQFNSLLRALLQADRQQLEQQFRLDFQDNGGERWQLTLTPIRSPLDKIFTRIVLDGQTYLEHIGLYDSQGDSTAITLSQQRSTPDQLTDEEQRHFAR